MDRRKPPSRAGVTGFRLLTLLVLLATFPGPFWRFPVIGTPLMDWSDRVQEGTLGSVENWAIVHVLHRSPGPRGGDSTEMLVRLIVLTVIAAVGAVLWTALDRHRRADAVQREWLRTYLRFWVGISVADYGVQKLLLFQMGYPPAPGELMSTVSQLAPQRLLWVLMATSPVYQVFTGAMEVVAAGLLLVRPTATIGALLVIGAMANVVVMDWAYRVPVVLLATGYLLGATLVLLPDVPRLWRVLVLGRAEPAPVRPSLFREPRRARFAAAVGLGVAGVALATSVHAAVTDVDSFFQPRPPLYGAYRVQSYQVDGQPALSDAQQRWCWLSVDYRWSDDVSGAGRICFADGSVAGFRMRLDPVGDSVTFLPLREDPRPPVTWRLMRRDSLHLELSGVDALPAGPPGTGAPVRVTLERVDLATSRLLERRPRFP